MTSKVKFICEADVAHITMDDGKANVMSLEMLQELDAALDRARAEKAMVLLRSAREGVFSAGFDLKVLATNDAERRLAMVTAGAELALKLMTFPNPTIGVMEGHAYPMGAFLLLACDIRLGAKGNSRIGLNEVVIGISPPRFAIELARSRLHPAWLSRTVTLGEMFEPEDAVVAGFLDRAVPSAEIDAAIDETLSRLKRVNAAFHAQAKLNLRKPAITAMRQAIDADLALEMSRSGNSRLVDAIQPRGAE